MGKLLEIAENNYVKISWGAAFAVGSAVVGIVLWLSSVDSRASDAINRLDRQKDAMRDMREDITKIKESAFRSEGILEILKTRSDNKF